jgi:DNA mismatch repair protein MutS
MLKTKFDAIVKSQGGAMLLFRMGDFYELYYGHAEAAAKILGLTLTTRSNRDGSPTPMAGFPYHQVTAYTAYLVHAGFKVEIVDNA